MTEDNQSDRLQFYLETYVEAVNRIEDHFEYRHDSEKDKAFVMSVIDGLTQKLARGAK